jgi:predicted TIM-barrel fold metal-dependent hydrolase
MSAPTSANAPPSGAVGVVDVDVHPTLTVNLSAVFEYMPREQSERVAYLGDIPLAQAPIAMNFLVGRWAVGRNAEPPAPDQPASTPERIRDDLLDGAGVAAAQLVATDAPAHALQSRNYDLASALASAFNDYLLEQWVVDERLRYALLVTPDDPDAALAELRRHGEDPRVSSVWIPPGRHRLGERHFDPVYRRALELGLPILSHPGGPRGTLAPPEYLLEGRFNAPQQTWAALSSLVALGAAERYPQLTFVFAECGFSWLPPVLRRMDAAWRGGRERVPQLERRPSEVVRAQVRFTTAPLDDDRSPEELAPLVEDLADVLVYASNHPRGGTAPDAFAAVSEATRRKIFADNAQAAMRL